MNRRTKWIAYNNLAWTEPIRATSEEYAEGTALPVSAIKEHSVNEVKTMLRLDCWATSNLFFCDLPKDSMHSLPSAKCLPSNSVYGIWQKK